MQRCMSCSKNFSCQYDLARHVRRNHNAVQLHCYNCEYSTKFKSSLIRHISVVHLNTSATRKCPRVLKCVLCSDNCYECVFRKQMTDHYVKEHNVNIQEKTFTFKTHSEFEQWKEAIEQADVCRFIADSGIKNNKTSRQRYYRCSRDGCFKTKGRGHRRLKIKGSMKMGGVCPASIKTKEVIGTGGIVATYVHTHVGHTLELNQLKLLKSERAEIARKLSLNIPFEDVLDSIRSPTGNQDLQRVHLTTRKDLWNIQQSFGLLKVDRNFIDNNSDTTWEAAEINEGAVVVLERFVDDNVLVKKKTKLKEKFEELLELVECDEHVDILWDALQSTIPKIENCRRTLRIKSNNEPITEVNLRKNPSPAKLCFATPNKNINSTNNLDYDEILTLPTAFLEFLK